MRSSSVKLLSAIVTVSAIVALWLLFAPAEIGGRSGYVVVNGASMEPALSAGDLAVIRTAPEYRVGDVITYRHPELGMVIHRIVGIEGSRFVVQGDNNSWIDSYMPVEQDIAGKLWFDIPGAGSYLKLARRPAVLSVLCLVVGAIIMLPVRRNDHKRTPTAALPSLAEPQGRDLLGLIAVLAVGALLLGGLAFSRPTERQALREIPYELQGAFSYSAPAPDGIYDAGVVVTGEPIFRELIGAFDVRFDYQLDSNAPVEGGGTANLRAELLADNGWSRSFELQPETVYTGPAASLAGTIDLSDLQRVIERVERATGVTARQYRLIIQPQVEFAGQVGGQSVSESFAPELEFQMDAQQLRLARSAANDQSALAPVVGGLVSQQATEANTLALGPFELDVARARQIAVIALAGLALVFAVLALGTLRGRGQSDAELLALRYAPRLVRLQAGAAEDDQDAIDVSSRADFERLLEHSFGPIFQSGQDFYIDYEGRRFRLRTSAPSGESETDPHRSTGRPSSAISNLLFQRKQREGRA